MTTDTITSVTLSVDLVKRLIQGHLNSQVLRCPHNVVDIDLVAETDSVVVTVDPVISRLTPAGCQAVTPETLLADLVDASPAERANGNGNGHNLGEPQLTQPATCAPVQPAPEVAPAEIIRLHQVGGITFGEIAERTGVGYSTAFRVVKEWKKQQADAGGAA